MRARITAVAVHLPERIVTSAEIEARVAAESPGYRPHATIVLRHVLLGEAPAPAGILRRAVAAAPSAEVLSVYAMTEILPVAIATAAEKLAHTESGASSDGGDLLGEPLSGVGVRLEDDGELVLSGPNLCRGYLGADPLTELPTGDLARLDEGRLILTGRKKDMLIRGRFNLYPACTSRRSPPCRT